MSEPTIQQVEMELSAASLICERPKSHDPKTKEFNIGGWFLFQSKHGWEIVEITNDSGGIKTVYASATLRGLSDFLKGIIYLHRDKRRRDAEWDSKPDLN